MSYSIKSYRLFVIQPLILDKYFKYYISIWYTYTHTPRKHDTLEVQVSGPEPEPQTLYTTYYYLLHLSVKYTRSSAPGAIHVPFLLVLVLYIFQICKPIIFLLYSPELPINYYNYNTPIYMSLCVCVEDDEYSLSSKSN